MDAVASVPAPHADNECEDWPGQIMTNRVWIQEFAEAATAVWQDLRVLWVKDVWPVLMTVWIFFVLAAPIIAVILVLWYLDSIGWQAGPGFFTIGAAGWLQGPHHVG
ncbi:hypothetical protein [Ideonella sp. A 288]|uniref:hypothetical protein n=1 Tax=Ideonella sp. A 288 TaxID=1962181 RepID=UPI001186B528|nr:hypothetical protein [Ideonella sp. A 288]